MEMMLNSRSSAGPWAPLSVRERKYRQESLTVRRAQSNRGIIAEPAGSTVLLHRAS